MIRIAEAVRNELVRRGVLQPVEDSAKVPKIASAKLSEFCASLLRLASQEDARLTEDLIAKYSSMLAMRLSSLGESIDEGIVVQNSASFLVDELPGLLSQGQQGQQGGEMLKQAQERTPENLGPGDAKKDFGDYLIPNMNKDTGMGKFETGVWSQMAEAGRTNLDKEHGDKERLYGPHIRIETVSAARSALTSVRSTVLDRLNMIASMKGRIHALAEDKKLPPWLEKKDKDKDEEPEKDEDKDEKEGEEKEPKEEGSKKPEAKKKDTKAVLEEALTVLEEIQSDLELLTGAARGIEEQLPPATLPMPEASKAYDSMKRYAVEGVVGDINARGASLDEVLMKVDDLISMLEEAVGKKKKEKKGEDVMAELKEGPVESKMEQIEIEGKPIKGNVGFFRRLFGMGPKQATSELPPGDAQKKDAKDLLAPNMNKDSGMGDYEVGWNKERANKGRRLLDKEHNIDITRVDERGKMQGIANVTPKLVKHEDRKKTAWVMYADVDGVQTPVMEATFQDVVPNPEDQTDANYGIFTDQAPHPATGQMYSAMIQTKLKKEGLVRVRANMHGKWLVKHAGMQKTAAESSVGDAPVAGENMSSSYLKAYYKKMFGSDEFASGLVKDMKAASSLHAMIKDYTLTKDAYKKLLAKVASLEAGKHYDLRVTRATDIARLEASRGLIPWEKTAVVKRATELASLSDDAVMQVQKIAEKLQVVNIKALAEEPPDHEKNATPGAAEMASPDAGIVHDTLEGVTDPGQKVTLEEGTLPEGVEKAMPGDGGSEVNPQEEYTEQTAGVSSEMIKKIQQQKAQLQKTASEVVPQLTTDGSEPAEGSLEKLGEALTARTTAGRAMAKGVNLGEFNKNFPKR